MVLLDHGAACVRFWKPRLLVFLSGLLACLERRLHSTLVSTQK
jgi:hypothetical protein